jgi:hypothetical protein
MAAADPGPYGDGALGSGAPVRHGNDRLFQTSAASP